MGSVFAVRSPSYPRGGISDVVAQGLVIPVLMVLTWGWIKGGSSYSTLLVIAEADEFARSVPASFNPVLQEMGLCTWLGRGTSHKDISRSTSSL